MTSVRVMGIAQVGTRRGEAGAGVASLTNRPLRRPRPYPAAAPTGNAPLATLVIDPPLNLCYTGNRLTMKDNDNLESNGICRHYCHRL